MSPSIRAGWRRRLAVFTVILLVSVIGLVWVTRGDLGPPGQPGSAPYLTVFLIDGLEQELFEREVAAGKLPELARLMQEGATIRNGIGAYPSMTGYAYYPFQTGHDAVYSGILGLRWFDRTRQQGNLRQYVGRTNVNMNPDLEDEPETFFEAFAGTHTSSINTLVDRGVHHHMTGGAAFVLAKFRERWWLPRMLSWVGLVPDLLESEADVVRRAIADLPNRPKIQWITLAGPDATNHVDGPDGIYEALVLHIDGLIGEYRAASRELGLEEDRIYAVLSDHGGAPVTQNLDLRGPLEAAGLRVDRDTAVRLSRELGGDLADVFGDVDAVLMVNGNTLNLFNFRHPDYDGVEGFAHRLHREHLVAYPTPEGDRVDVIASLTALPGVEHVASLDADGHVSIDSARGRGIITVDADRQEYAYTFEGEDPLGYAGDDTVAPLLDGAAHPETVWLTLTRRTDFPYAVVRVADLVRLKHCADLVVTAARGYDLAADFEWFVGNYEGGHGGMRADQLRVPYILSGPGVRPGAQIPVARAEDVGRTLFHLLGIEASDALTGRVLGEALVGESDDEGSPF